MATYLDIFGLRSSDTLRNKVSVAITVKAAALIDAANPTNAQIAWANAAVLNPAAKTDGLLTYLLAKNNALTTGQISGVSDADIQTAVNAAVDKLIAGGA